MVPGVHDTVGLTDEFFRAVAADFSKFGIYEGNFPRASVTETIACRSSAR